MIPTAALPDVLTIEPFQGSGAYGPQFGAAFTVRARVEGRRRAVRKADGTDVIASATAIIRPGAPTIPVESKASHAGVDYEVLDVVRGEGLRRLAYLEVLLS